MLYSSQEVFLSDHTAVEDLLIACLKIVNNSRRYAYSISVRITYWFYPMSIAWVL